MDNRVERGFLDNKENLSNNIVFRRAYDGIKQEGIPIKDCITKELLINIMSSCAKKASLPP